MKAILTTSLAIEETPVSDLTTGKITLSLPRLISTLENGTGVNQVNRAFADAGSLAGSASVSLDLFDFAGALDLIGRAFALSKIRVLVIRNTSDPVTAAASILRVGGEGTGAAWNAVNGSDTVPIADVHPGGELILEAPTAAGYAVADATNHLL